MDVTLPFCVGGCRLDGSGNRGTTASCLHQVVGGTRYTDHWELFADSFCWRVFHGWLMAGVSEHELAPRNPTGGFLGGSTTALNAVAGALWALLRRLDGAFPARQPHSTQSKGTGVRIVDVSGGLSCRLRSLRVSIIAGSPSELRPFLRRAKHLSCSRRRRALGSCHRSFGRRRSAQTAVRRRYRPMLRTTRRSARSNPALDVSHRISFLKAPAGR